jgi:hypothetical protein
MWDDFWGNLNKPVPKQDFYGTGWTQENDPYMAKTRAGDMINGSSNQQGRRPAPAQSNSMRTILNVGKLPGLAVDNSVATGNKMLKDPGMEREESYEDKLLARKAEIEMAMDSPYADDPEIAAMIDEAYSGALANISKARGDAESNFQRSDANIAALSAGHVNTIKTDDLNAVKRIGGDLQSGYQQTFDTAKNEMQSNRSAELAERTAMLQRLGIQEAGLGDAGQGETAAIEDMSARQAGAMKQAQGYQAADEVRNTEQAQSQASAGVERRSALNSDLQKILGTLGNSEAEIQSSMSQDKLRAKQSGKSDYMDMQRFNLESLDQIDSQLQDRAESDRNYDLELKKLAQKNSTGSGGVYDAVANDFRNRGIAPEEYESAYAQVASSATFNAAVDGDKSLWMIRQMKKKNPKLSENDIARYVSGVTNYGTDKLGNS